MSHFMDNSTKTPLLEVVGHEVGPSALPWALLFLQPPTPGLSACIQGQDSTEIPPHLPCPRYCQHGDKTEQSKVTTENLL